MSEEETKGKGEVQPAQGIQNQLVKAVHTHTSIP